MDASSPIASTRVTWSRRSALGALSLVPVGTVVGCSGEPGRTPSQVAPSDSSSSASSAGPAPSSSASTAASSTPTPTPSATPAGPVGKIKAADWATGLTSPWGLDFVDDDTVLVSERDTQKILLLSGGAVRTVATVDEAVPHGEAGLLGLRLSPDRDQLFVYYTAAQDNRVARYAFDGRRATDPKVIVSGIAKAGNHDGGQLRFGPDGMLYVATGDASNGDAAQDRNSLSGKILRVTTHGMAAAGNPFDNQVWSMGHRNVQGIVFDDDDRLWACEFGQNTWDEINLITKGGNYGWPAVEGNESTVDGMINPKAQWRTDDASPSSVAYWRGALWMAGLKGARLWQIPVNGPDNGEPVAHLEGDYGRLRSVQVFPDGSGLLLGTSNTDGRSTPRDGDDRLLKITPA